MSAANLKTPAGPLKYKYTPVRILLATILVLSLSFSAVFSAFGIMVYNKIGNQMTGIHQTAAYLHIFIYTFFVIICLLGLYGCIAKRADATSLLASLVLGQILFSIASGALCLHLLFNDTPAKSWNTERCLVVAFDKLTRELCHTAGLVKGILIAVFIVMWLIEIVIIIVANVFLSRLRAEAARLHELDPKYDSDNDWDDSA